MKKNLLLVLAILIASSVFSQENYAQWVQFVDGQHNNTNINNVITDGESVYANGTYTLNAVFQGIDLPEDLGTNVILTKLDTEGNVIWLNTIIGDGFDAFYDMALDSNGDLIATGWFSTKTDFILNGNVIIPADNLWTNKSLVAKFSKEDGSLIWLKYWSSEEFMSANAIKLAIDANDNVYVGGYYSSDFQIDDVTVTFNKTMGEDVFLIKFDNEGNAVWGKTIETADDGGWSRTRSMTANENGLFYVFDYNQDVVVNGENVLPYGDGYSLCLVKYSPDDGDVEGFLSFGSTTGNQSVNHIISDNENNLLMGGYFTDATGFEIAGTEPTGYGSEDGFIAKLNSNLELEWIKTMGGGSLDRVFNLFTNDAGDIFAGGGFDNFTGFSYDGTEIIDSHDPNSLSMFQLHLKNDGSFNQALALLGYDNAASISNNNTVVMSNGEVITGGRITGRAVFEEGGDIMDTEEHAMGFVMKWDTPFEVMAAADQPENTLTVYPNPFNSQITIHLKNNEPVQLGIYDLAGRKVYSDNLSATRTIRLNHLQPGIYILKVNARSFTQSFKLIKK